MSDTIEDQIFAAICEARASGQTEITTLQLEEFYSRFVEIRNTLDNLPPELARLKAQVEDGRARLKADQALMLSANGDLKHREREMSLAATQGADRTATLAGLEDRERLTREVADWQERALQASGQRDVLQGKVKDALELARLVLLEGVTPASELGKALSRVLGRPL